VYRGGAAQRGVRAHSVRAIRVFLQVLVIALFVLLLTVFAHQPFDPVSFIGVSIFVGFLFSLTLMLREHTESRLSTRKIDPKVLSSFLVFVGAGLCCVAWRIALGEPMSNSWRGRRLNSIIEITGPWLPSAFFLALGIFVLWGAYRALRSNEL
jgi:hypothetical protein